MTDATTPATPTAAGTYVPIPQSHHDLLDTPIPVALATIGTSGYPQVTYVWVIREGDTVVTSVTGSRQKFKNLQARPQATVFAVDPANPFRTLEIRGDVTLTPDPELRTLGAVVTAYGTTIDGFGGPDEARYTVVLRPVRVVTQS